MKIGGIHILLDIKNCQVKKLDNIIYLRSLVDHLAKFCQLNVLNIAEHKYEPHGVSIVALVSESHISIHTWPEADFLSCDIYSCSEKDIKYIKLKDYLEDELKGQANLILIKREKGKIKVLTDD